MQISFQAFFAGAIQPSTPCFHQKRQTPAEAPQNHIKKPPPLTRGVWDGRAGVECRKAAAYRGSRLSGEHSHTGPHPTAHRKGNRTEGAWAAGGKDSRKPSNSIRSTSQQEDKCSAGSGTTKSHRLSWTRPTGTASAPSPDKVPTVNTLPKPERVRQPTT